MNELEATYAVKALRGALTELVTGLGRIHTFECDFCGDGYPCSTGDVYKRTQQQLQELEAPPQ